MTGVMVALAFGLAAGGIVGFALGAEHPARCLECGYGSEGQYRRGMEDGWRDCATAVRMELDRVVGQTVTEDQAAGICRRIGGEGGVAR